MEEELKQGSTRETTLQNLSSDKSQKLLSSGLVLIPQPSDDPADPLNWPEWKKLRLLTVLSLAAFSCTASASAGQLAYVIQAPLYHRTSLELSYTVSAQLAGLAVGPLFTAPLAFIFGRSSMIFWSILLALGCSVWSARMANETDYIPFLVARVFSGVCGALPTALGSSIIMDIYFLHARGTAFLVYSIGIGLGTIAGSTFGGFILGHQSWMVCFWWTVPLLGIMAIPAFVFLEETHYDRNEHTGRLTLPVGIAANRVATFFPGTRTTRFSGSEIVKHAAAPFLIGLSPAIILIGVFIMIVFGWAILLDILLPLFLQTPIKEGGYGFSAAQNAAFSFAEWMGLLAAQIFGTFFNDVYPLWICKRYKQGIWAPELRLYCLWVPVLVLPIGLGLSGAALQYHTHYMVLALGVFIVAFGALLAVPIVINYTAECFTQHATECTIVIQIYRLGWGVAIPFFIAQWEAEVKVGWVFGMAAFFTLASATLVLLLLWKGHVLRQWHLMRSLACTEEGLRVN